MLKLLTIGVGLQSNLFEWDGLKPEFPRRRIFRQRKAFRCRSDQFWVGSRKVIAQFERLWFRVPTGIKPFSDGHVVRNDVSFGRNSFESVADKGGALRRTIIGVERFHGRITLAIEAQWDCGELFPHIIIHHPAPDGRAVQAATVPRTAGSQSTKRLFSTRWSRPPPMNIAQ